MDFRIFAKTNRTIVRPFLLTNTYVYTSISQPGGCEPLDKGPHWSEIVKR